MTEELKTLLLVIGMIIVAVVVVNFIRRRS
jgi:hypothetical protein